MLNQTVLDTEKWVARMQTLEIIFGGQCNLRCKYCYVNHQELHPDPDPKTLLSFLIDYNAYHPIKSIDFCGWGEVFTNSAFVPLLNEIHRIFPAIRLNVQTNGTLYRCLEDIDSDCWNVLSFAVSIDGLEAQHDFNRGTGMFKRTVRFLDFIKNRAQNVSIRSILTRENRNEFPQFFLEMQSRLSPCIPSFHICIPNEMILSQMNPVYNILTHKEIISFYEEHQSYLDLNDLDSQCSEIYPTIHRNRIYSCCELHYPVAKLTDSIETITHRMFRACQTRCGQCRAYSTGYLI